jgi:hypothetical protein
MQQRRFYIGYDQIITNENIIKGFGNSETIIKYIGTILWNIIDDDGVKRTITIPNSYYVPTSGVRLLSPQHWSQESNEVNNKGIICITYGDKIIIKWNNQQYKKTIPLIRSPCNTGIMWSQPTYNKYNAFITKLNQQFLLVASDHVTTNDNDGNDDDSFIEEEHHMVSKHNNDDDEDDDNETLYHIQNITIRNEKELLLYHEKMGHIPFKLIQHAATQGLLPKRLSKCKIPICPSCLNGKLSYKPWRT